MTRVLITGGAGFLGRALTREAPADVELHVTRRSSSPPRGIAHEVELSDGAAVRDLWGRIRPDLVVHTAYSTRDGERDILRASREVARATAELGASLIHLSSDLVLDGEHAPYDESAPPAPVNEYGRLKAEAEAAVREAAPSAAIVRTSLITSLDPLDPRCAWIAEGLRGETRVSLFTDEIRCPISDSDLARQIWEIAALAPERRAGVWNLVGPEAVSRYTIGLIVAAALRVPPDPLVPASLATHPDPRPRDLRLLTTRADRELSTRARGISDLLSR